MDNILQHIHSYKARYNPVEMGKEELGQSYVNNLIKGQMFEQVATQTVEHLFNSIGQERRVIEDNVEIIDYKVEWITMTLPEMVEFFHHLEMYPNKVSDFARMLNKRIHEFKNYYKPLDDDTSGESES